MILNLTQHRATPAQREAGVVDLPEERAAELSQLLNFEELPDRAEVYTRARRIVSLAHKAAAGIPEEIDAVMIGGAPFLIVPLHEKFTRAKIRVAYAFSQRESVERHVDGKVIKTQVFNHLGFVYLDDWPFD